MEEEIEVHIEYDSVTHFVGMCRYYRRGRSQSSTFEYDQTWLDFPESFAIDPENLPLTPGPFHRSSSNSGLPGAIRDTAPDRWGQQLIRRAFRKQNENRALSEIDYLLAINDQTRIGALRYKREGEEAFDHDVGTYRVPPLVSLLALLNAADAVNSNTETAEDLRLLLNEGSPLGGARPKSAVQDQDGSLAIAKFPKPDDDRSIPHGEVLAMELAKKAGIDVANARLVSVADRPVALIKRFDRDSNSRIPFISAMTFLAKDDGEASTYTEITEVIRKHSREPTKDLHELWRRVVFNVMSSNLDDHLRNHGFLYDGNGLWRLSPAYDLNPMPAYEKVREMTTWISEEGPDANVDIAIRAAEYFRLKESEASEILDEVTGAFHRWTDTAKGIGMSNSDIEQYATALPPT
ncbi:MAG: type II toxin-antitoxin system HipA family toxin [Desulfuromusa sp.]|nr:type II toxin-antitoxin system HipA family toxin [Desulfuromusa sp.]